MENYNANVKIGDIICYTYNDGTLFNFIEVVEKNGKSVIYGKDISAMVDISYGSDFDGLDNKDIITIKFRPIKGQYKNNFPAKYRIVRNIDNTNKKGIKVKRVIKFVNDIYGTNISKRELDAMLQIFGINEFYNKNASSLSGGQSQRLNCLLAILNKPKFIILDELSTGLDVTIRNKIKTFIKEYAKENNITILIISHDMDEVDYIADRIVIMKKGNIYLDMDKSDVIKKYKTLNNCISNYV